MKWSSTWPLGSGPFTLRSADQVAPPSAESEITVSLWPSERNRVSCHATYMWSLLGSMAAAGRPPVRMPGSPAPRNSAIVTIGPHVKPPSVEVMATSKSRPPTNWSVTTVTLPFELIRGSCPSVSAPGAMWMRSLQVAPSSSE